MTAFRVVSRAVGADETTWEGASTDVDSNSCSMSDSDGVANVAASEALKPLAAMTAGGLSKGRCSVPAAAATCHEGGFSKGRCLLPGAAAVRNDGGASAAASRIMAAAAAAARGGGTVARGGGTVARGGGGVAGSILSTSAESAGDARVAALARRAGAADEPLAAARYPPPLSASKVGAPPGTFWHRPIAVPPRRRTDLDLASGAPAALATFTMGEFAQDETQKMAAARRARVPVKVSQLASFAMGFGPGFLARHLDPAVPAKKWPVYGDTPGAKEAAAKLELYQQDMPVKKVVLACFFEADCTPTTVAPSSRNASATSAAAAAASHGNGGGLFCDARGGRGGVRGGYGGSGLSTASGLGAFGIMKLGRGGGLLPAPMLATEGAAR